MEAIHYLITPEDVGNFLVLLAAYILFVFIPFSAIFYGVYYLHTLPLRRKERARIFLDLLELGVQEGARPERALTIAFSRPIRPLGKGFRRVGEYLAKGFPLSQALALEPTLLPPAVNAMLATGERLGDISKVIPACRIHLGSALSQVRAAINYLVLLLFVVTPASIIIPAFLAVKVVPKLKEVFEGMGGMVLPAFTRFILGQGGTYLFLQVVLFVAMMIALAIYVGGPRLHSAVNAVFPNVADWLAYRVPWKRKRLHRDFSLILSVLLDSGVPEYEAIEMAAESTASAPLIRRARVAQERLAAGSTLTDAIGVIDETGEFRWRMRNATHRQRGFFAALTGWHEALEAKAFQQEQNAAQLSTTVLVLVNGLFVGSVVVSVFMVLVSILNSVALW